MLYLFVIVAFLAGAFWLFRPKHQRLAELGGVNWRLHPDRSPIFEHEGRWYFMDENWERCHGPYVTLVEARAALLQYARFLEGASEQYPDWMEDPRVG